MTRKGWISAALVVAAALGLLGPVGLRLALFPIGLAGLVGVFDELRARERLPGWLGEALGPAGLVVLAVFFYGRLLLGDIPVNHDHPVFLFRAWHTAWLLVHQGTALGYSPFMFVGLPANGLYPLGVDFLVIGVKLLGLGLISWETAYGWALFLFVLLGTGSMYLVGRLAGGKVCGTLCGVLWLLDRGAWFQGGWSFSLDWGVWSMGLSAALCVLTIYGTERLMRAPGRWWVLGVAAAAGGAVLSHPMAVAILGLALPLLVVCEWLRSSPGPAGDWLVPVGGALLLAGGLCAFWLLPFMARREWFEPLGYHWTDYPEMVRRLWGGRLLEDTSPVVLLGGVLGLWWGAWRRVALAFFFLVTSAVFLYVASDSFFLDLGALEKFPSLANLQTERFAYFVRVGLLLGLSLALTLPWRETVREGSCSAGAARAGEGGGWRRQLKVLLAGAALAPLVAYLPRVGELPFLTPTRPLVYASGADIYRDLKKAAEFLNSQDRKEIGRVAIRTSYSHDLLMVLLAVYTELPFFKNGSTPENNTRYKVHSEDPSVWRAAGVTHALVEGPMGGPGFVELGRFGRLWLYRLEGADPRPAWLEGPGELTVLDDRPERLELELRGTSAESRLVVRRARYALWQARLDGRPVAIGPRVLGDQPLMMELAAGDGRLVLEYRAGFAEWAGGILSLLALAVFLLLAVAGLGPVGRVYGRALSFLTGKRREWLARGIIALAGVALAGVLLKLLLPAPSPFTGRRVETDFLSNLSRGRAKIVTAGRATACPFDGGRHACPHHPWIFAGPVVLSADQLIRRCLWLHPVDNSEFFIHFDGIELADRLEGFFGIDDSAAWPPTAGEVQFRVYIDGQPQGNFSCPSRRGWFHWEVDTSERKGRTVRVSFSSAAAFTGRRHFCFTAYVTGGGT